jgi:sn-glycerol 3-phosphate transport system ATP-binding protein
MRLEIQKLHRRLRTTSLYVTHDQVEAMTLADRMIVMNAGRAEQIGAPMDVYRNPATLFVAGFIGSPAMNFLPAKAEGGGRFALDGGGSVVAPNGHAAQGAAVTLGIRPEHLLPSDAGSAIVGGEVQMVEQLGADTLVHVAHGNETVIARLPHGQHPDVGTTLHLGADPARVFLFDSTSGARL